VVGPQGVHRAEPPILRDVLRPAREKETKLRSPDEI